MSTVGEILEVAAVILREAGIERPRREAQALLSSRFLHFSHPDCALSLEFILAHPEAKIDSEIEQSFRKIVADRAARVPLAYINREKDFYGRNFIVTTDTLIPRPETETLIDIVKELIANSDKKGHPRILDVGTGCGAIAITLAKELPYAHVTASDISAKALDIARQNAAKFNAEIDFVKSDLLKNIAAEKFDLIAANLPYVDPGWHVERTCPEILHEPSTAIFAEDGGLSLIKKLIRQAPGYLASGGSLILEMDPAQMAEISSFATKIGFCEIKCQGYALTLRCE